MNEIEQQVIGGLIQLGDMQTDQAQFALSKIKPASFVCTINRMIFESIGRLADKGAELDPFTIDHECQKDKRYEDGAFEYLCEIASNVSSAANIHVYASKLMDASIQRFASQKLNEAIVLVNSPDGTITERLGQVESMISQISERVSKAQDRGLRHIGDISAQWFKEFNSRIESGNSGGYTFGIEALDKLLLPKAVPEGSLVIIGARPKMGKTAVMSAIIDHFAVDRKEAVATFSLEMSESQMYERLLIGRSKANPKILYEPPTENSDFGDIMEAITALKQTELYIDDTAGVNLSHIKREARKLNKKTQIGLIAVDYLTLMEAEKADRNDLAYGMISTGLKNLAKELGCVVLLLTQLNRKLEDRTNKRPMPSDSRDTGSIEQDCDLWIGLYREAVYNEDFENKGLTEMIVRLNRHGDVGTVYGEMKNGTMQSICQYEGQELSSASKKKPTRPRF